MQEASIEVSVFLGLLQVYNQSRHVVYVQLWYKPAKLRFSSPEYSLSNHLVHTYEKANYAIAPSDEPTTHATQLLPP